MLYARLAFVMWGLFPPYFRHLASVPALELVLYSLDGWRHSRSAVLAPA